MVKGSIQVAHELLRPVTLLTSFLGGPKIFDRGSNWPLIITSHHPHQLVNSVNFCLHECGSTRAHMASGAFDASVRGMEICSVFRLHWTMTGQATKLH